MQGKTAIITGGGSGLGEAAAHRFAKGGVRVLIGDINLENAERVCEDIRQAGGEARAAKVDVSDSASVAGFFEHAIQHFGRLDIALNNAGISGKIAGVGETDIADFDRVLAINLRGVFLCLREEAKIFKAQGSGVIVNTASSFALIGTPNICAYVAAKHGVVGLTKAVALELAPSGIRVNAVCPGIIRTHLMDDLNLTTENFDAMTANLPIGRLATADEIAEAMFWLASPASGYVTAISMPVDGGWTAH